MIGRNFIVKIAVNFSGYKKLYCKKTQKISTKNFLTLPKNHQKIEMISLSCNVNDHVN